MSDQETLALALFRRGIGTVVEEQDEDTATLWVSNGRRHGRVKLESIKASAEYTEDWADMVARYVNGKDKWSVTPTAS